MAEIKSGDIAYEVGESPVYDPEIRALKRSDPADADTVFNPLLGKIINNVHAVYQNAGNHNLLINGDFSVWQRGKEFYSKQKKISFTADRWRFGEWGADNNTKISPSTVVPPGESGYSMMLEIKESEPDMMLFQNLEEDLVPGCEYTLSTWVKGPAGSYHHMSIKNICTPIFSLTGEWQYRSYTFTVNEANKNMICPFRIGSKPGTYYVKNVKLEKGRVATPFVKRSYAEELLLCQRYFVKLPRGTKAWVTQAWSGAINLAISTPVQMRIPPVFSAPDGFLIKTIKDQYETGFTFTGVTQLGLSYIEFTLVKANHGMTEFFVWVEGENAYLDAEIL